MTSMKTGIPERIVDEIIHHQFKSAKDAAEDNQSLELAGFGKFIFNVKKAKEKVGRLNEYIKKMEWELENPEKRTKSLEWINGIVEKQTEQINQLNKIINND